MQTKDFDYHLPKHLIAQHPPENRGQSRLLCVDKHTGVLADKQFADFVDLVNADDLLVFNNTRVLPARLFGHKSSGGQVEFMLERVLDQRRVLAQLRVSKAPKAGSVLDFAAAGTAEVLGREGRFFELRFEKAVVEILEQHGKIPLPPYIKRDTDNDDLERYQTVYAQVQGAVAAPTAGLHFDTTHLEALKAKGVAQAFVTLHVGAGTFQPVQVDDLSQHQMHAESLEVSAEVCEQIAATKTRGGRVIAIGTTTVRALETAAAATGKLQPYQGDSRLFITPGYEFKVIDALLTNFHLPESTLLMLVSALANREQMLNAYQHAIEAEYRFFSYGDAMFIN